MSTVKRFEDLDCWKEARELCKIVYHLVKENPFSRDFNLVDQISRSSGSTMDNIAEGFERGSNKEFIQFLYISKSSSAEVKSQLYRALDRSHISEVKFTNGYDKADRVGKLIQGLITYLKNSSLKGRKFN